MGNKKCETEMQLHGRYFSFVLNISYIEDLKRLNLGFYCIDHLVGVKVIKRVVSLYSPNVLTAVRQSYLTLLI